MRRLPVRHLVELFALTGFAITQPVLDTFGRAPDLFVFRDADRVDIVAFAVLVATVPTLVLWLVEVVAGLVSTRAVTWCHRAFVVGLVALIALQVPFWPAWAGLGVAVAGGTVAAALLVRARSAWPSSRVWPISRTWLAYCGLAPILFVGVFLLSSPVSDLLDSRHVDAAVIGPVRQPRSVVFLQFDEWPLRSLINQDGVIDPELYPNLAALSEEGTWYRNTTTVSTYTQYAVPAILTGRVPERHGIAVARAYPENLFTLLANRFDLDVIETVTQLCPPNLCTGDLLDDPGAGETAAPPVAAAPAPRPEPPSALPDLLRDARRAYRLMIDPGAEDTDATQTLVEDTVPVPTPSTTLLPGQGPTTEEAVDDARGASAPEEWDFGLVATPILNFQSVTDLVDSIERHEVPTVHFLHLLLPHGPYRFLPSGQAYDDPAAMFIRGSFDHAPTPAEETDAFVANHEQRLILQAGYADRVVGEVVDRLRQTGQYDDSILVVAADHGVGLTPGQPGREVLTDDDTAYPDLLFVPLIVHAPGLEAGPTDVAAQTIDILPTLADLLGVDLPWAVDGRSLLEGEAPSDDRTVLAGEADDPITPITVDGGEYFDEMLARNLDRLFRSDNPAHRLYAITDAGDLVGRDVGDLDVSGRSAWFAVLDDPDRLATVDPDGGSVPTRLLGRLDGRGAPPTVAVAVNGTIGAVVGIFDDGGPDPHRLDAMIDPQVLRPGANEVTLFEVTGAEGAWRLAPISVS